jgi:hypothetical protein
MDQNDPAWKLAQATVASLSDRGDALDRALRELKPTSGDVARAYALCLTTPPFASTEATRLTAPVGAALVSGLPGKGRRRMEYIQYINIPVAVVSAILGALLGAWINCLASTRFAGDDSHFFRFFGFKTVPVGAV